MNHSRKGNESPGGTDDRALVSEFLQEVSELSQREVDRTVPGVSQSDVSRWRNNEWEYITAKKRRALRAFLEGTGGEGSEAGIPIRERGDPSGTPAEQLLYHLTQPGPMRRLIQELGVETVLKAAYGVAIEERWPEEEVRKLDAWRQAVMSGAPDSNTSGEDEE